jgi:hypothetical protein
VAEIYSELGLPAMALPYIVDSLTICENNHLPSQQSMLCLAQLQVYFYTIIIQTTIAYSFK